MPDLDPRSGPWGRLVDRAAQDQEGAPLLVLDVDGTIRHGKDELGRFVNGPGDVVVFPDAAARIAEAYAAGWTVIAISNQGGIGDGHVTRRAVAEAMAETLVQVHQLAPPVGRAGARDLITDLSWCPDPTDAGCWCRKPAPGLVLGAIGRLAARYPTADYQPTTTIVVGDRPEDCKLAQNLRCQFMDAAAWRAGGLDLDGFTDAR